jgi:hypothetical protein
MGSDPDRRRRFSAGGPFSGGAQSPNIVAVYEVDDEHDTGPEKQVLFQRLFLRWSS